MTDAEMLDIARRLRRVATKTGPQHSYWDAIFDAEAIVAGREAILSRPEVERLLMKCASEVAAGEEK